MKITMAEKGLKSIVCESSEAWCLDDTLTGVCIKCGDVSEGQCEPDASNYICTECGRSSVYGFSNLVLMGFVTIVD
jgi:hypothetical protein